MNLSNALTISSHGLQMPGDRLRALAATLAGQDASASPSTVGSGRQSGGNPAKRRVRLSTARATSGPRGGLYSPDLDASAEGGNAHLTHDANLAVLDATRSLLTRALDMLR